jgi:hypothetical protein
MFHPGAIKTTARKLIQERLGYRAANRLSLRDAVEDVMFKGWIPNYLPARHEFDRSVIFVPQTHKYAAIFRCLGRAGIGPVPRGLVESRTGTRLHHAMTGLWLSRYGLAIQALDGNDVILRGTSVGMAGTVNLRRYDESHLIRSAVLIEHATGLSVRPCLITDELRLRAAIEFDSFDIEVPGLLDGESESQVISRWRFPATPAPSADIPF